MLDAVIRWTALLALCGLSGCAREPEAPPLSYEGASTISETVLPELIAGYERTSGRKFGAVASRGSTEGVDAVLEGRASLGGVSRPLKPTEKARGLYYEIIGYDAVAVFVHRSNPIRSLTRRQLRDVFSGRISSWKELGGPNVPIERVVEQDEHRGTIAFFREAVLESTPIGAATRFERPAECVRYVATHPHAVTYASAAFSLEEVKAVAIDGVLPGRETIVSAEYPITRPLLLISRDVPEGQTRRFYDFVHSPEGRGVLAHAFFPLTGLP